MIFSTEQVMDLVKLSLTPQEKKRTADIRLAMGAALDELSMRLKSQSFLTSYSQTVSADTRTLQLKGNNDDLRYLFALKMGTGSEERILSYIEQQSFLRDYDSSDAADGVPAVYTILNSSEGFPVVKFDRALDVSQTLITYYYVDITPDNMTFSKSMSAVAAGTLAYFFGPTTVRGAPSYLQFQQLASLARASDDPLASEPTDILLSRQDRNLNRIIRTKQIARS